MSPYKGRGLMKSRQMTSKFLVLGLVLALGLTSACGGGKKSGDTEADKNATAAAAGTPSNPSDPANPATGPAAPGNPPANPADPGSGETQNSISVTALSMFSLNVGDSTSLFDRSSSSEFSSDAYGRSLQIGQFYDDYMQKIFDSQLSLFGVSAVEHTKKNIIQYIPSLAGRPIELMLPVASIDSPDHSRRYYHPLTIQNELYVISGSLDVSTPMDAVIYHYNMLSHTLEGLCSIDAPTWALIGQTVFFLRNGELRSTPLSVCDYYGTLVKSGFAGGSALFGVGDNLLAVKGFYDASGQYSFTINEINKSNGSILRSKVMDKIPGYNLPSDTRNIFAGDDALYWALISSDRRSFQISRYIPGQGEDQLFAMDTDGELYSDFITFDSANNKILFVYRDSNINFALYDQSVDSYELETLVLSDADRQFLFESSVFAHYEIADLTLEVPVQ